MTEGWIVMPEVPSPEQALAALRVLIESGPPPGLSAGRRLGWYALAQEARLVLAGLSPRDADGKAWTT